MSLGQVNYFLKLFSNEQWIERAGLHGNGAHHAESYLVTDKGLAARSELGARVLPIKLIEFNCLRQQIEHFSKCSMPDDANH